MYYSNFKQFSAKKNGLEFFLSSLLKYPNMSTLFIFINIILTRSLI